MKTMKSIKSVLNAKIKKKQTWSLSNVLHVADRDTGICVKQCNLIIQVELKYLSYFQVLFYK
jgi:hypothetical protein